jgi:DNA-binding transcriptional ArsR family regulator
LVFEALADPTRREILRFLADRGESPVGEIAVGVGTVSRTGVSNHLRFLRVAELVSERRDGRYRLYSIDRAAVDGVVEFLAALYGSPLRELKRRLETPAEDDTPAEGAEQHGRSRTRQ